MLTANTGKEVSDAMDVVNRLLQGFGVEVIRGSEWYNHYWGDIVMEYVNQGDMYYPTVLYDVEKQKFECTTWSDWMELAQKHGRSDLRQ